MDRRDLYRPSNINERNHQVGMMGDVYRTARCVRDWLGRGNAESAVTLKPLNQTVLFYRLVDKLPPRLGRIAWQFFQLWSHAVNRLRPNSCIDRSLIFDRLHSSYWSRVWIIQEVILARKLIIHRGEDNVKWLNFRSWSPWLWVTGGPTTDITREVFRLREGYLRGRRSLSLTSLLRHSKDCGATDTRDRIFALLGLVDEDVRHAIPVDYNLTTLELQERVAIHYGGLNLWNDWKMKGSNDSWRHANSDKCHALCFFDDMETAL